MSMHDTRSQLPTRDTFGLVALGVAAVSLVGFLVLVIGHLADPSDFNNTKHAAAADYAAFFAFVVGLILALLLGASSWFYGRRSGRTGPRSPAALATYYGVVFLVVAVVAGALGA